MGSGHNRNGRGNNRRARNGPPQRDGRGPQNLNGQRNGQPALMAVSPRPRQGPPASQPGHTPPPATTAYEAELDVVEVDEVAVVEGDEGGAVVEVHEVRAELRVAPDSAGEPDDPPPAKNAAAVGDSAPIRPERQAQQPAPRGQRQPYVPAMPNGRQGPPAARPPAQGAAFVAKPAEARRPPARSVEVDDDEGAETAPSQAVARSRPERFVVTERPQREHGERYQHIPGTPDIRGEVGALIDSLRTLFQDDRTVASQSGATRCGICYFHYPLSTLAYREDGGYYVCQRCAKSLGGTPLNMVRRQQRL